MTKLFKNSTAILLAAFCVNVGVGQQSQISPAQNQVQNARPTNSAQLDRAMVEFFASKLVLCNNAQIQMSKLVAEKGENSEVKKFAEMLGDDHAKLNQQLKPFVANYGQQLASNTTDRVTAFKPVAQNQVGQPGQVPSNSNFQTQTGSQIGDQATLHRLFEICQAAHENQMAAGKEMLTQKSGSELDKAYISSQIAGHMALAAELKALESRSPGDFQIVIREASDSVDSHMQKALSICKDLDKDHDKNQTTSR